MTITAASLLGLGLKSLLIAGLTLAILRLVRSRSAAERSLVAHAGLVALLALPVAALLLPQWTPLPAAWSVRQAAALPVTEVAAMPAEALHDAAPVAAATWNWPSLSDMALGIYALPLLLLFALMALAVVRLFAMRARADVLVEASWLSALAEAQRRMGFKHGTALLVSEELRSPISWGVLRPTIVLSPKAVGAVGEAEAIIAHELAHVARLDWAKLLAARLACALFWFNPLVWMLARESHQLREEAADDAVLMADIDGPDYATLLVGAARHDNQGALLAAHGVAPGKGSLKRRITRVLDASLKRGPASASWMLMSLVLLAGITAPLAAFSATTGQRAAAAVHAVAAPAPTAAPQSAAVAGGAPEAATPAAPVAKPQAGPLTVDELVGMRAVGVTPEDVRAMRRHGSVDSDDIIAAKASGVDPDYIAAMRRLFPHAALDDLIGARALGVSPDYARAMQAQFPDVDLDDLTAMRAVGVTPDYVARMRRAGQPLADPDDAIEARTVGSWGSGRHSVVRSRSGATVRAEAGGSVEVRSADGAVVRVAAPSPPGPPRPPVVPKD